MIPYAVALYQNSLMENCESVIKQILEKNQKVYRDDIAMIRF
jgi:hypothetical protein